ncbi:MAG: hypothetical protein H6839_07105 [Planctomycetes bacterium]|nr:hypothetical protein [Planctomycetota bacterium]
MAASKKSERKSAESLRSGKGKASLAFAGAVLAVLAGGATYLQLTDQWGVVTGAAALKYQNWFEGLVNDPDNEEYRTELITHVVEHYKQTPSKKSLPLRNDAGQVVGRFRIKSAEVDQPNRGSTDPAERRIYTVDLQGSGELWHETGGRVRFHGTAFVTYSVDFKVEDWAALAYFQCLDVQRPKFECDHIDNILGQIFIGAVRSAGTEALDESLRPGFTVIAKANGDTYLAGGKVSASFTPRKGPFEETDAGEGFETIQNDVTLLHAGYRDYLGPIELFDDSELRVTIETESLEPRKTFGADVYILNEEQFQLYESHYPSKLDDLKELPRLDSRYDVSKLNMDRQDLTGNVYILIDYTGWGNGRDPDDRAEAALVRYYVRAKR